jgi:SRSO17 transposase
MRQTYHGLVADEMGDPDGVLMFDESGFVKKGKDSVGVARQYCGTLGKVEKSQVGVCAAYASRHGYALVDKRLFMPQQWFTEDYKDKRDKCNVPKDVTFHTKPQLAVEMLQAIRSKGRLPFKSIVADCLYGNSPDFLAAVDSCVGVTSLVSIPAETRCWLQRPLTTENTYRYQQFPLLGPIASDVRFKKRVWDSLAIHFALIPMFPQSEKARCLIEKDTKS